MDVTEALRAELRAFKEGVQLMEWKLSAFERKLGENDKEDVEIHLRTLRRELCVSRAMADELLELVGHL